MTLVITLVIFILIFGLIVFVHELGHFLVAKKSGILVEEFGFGFPPKLYSRKIGETKYVINAVPLGGYVKMLGEERTSADPRSFSQQPAWVRVLISLAGVTMNLLLAWVVLSVVLWLPNSVKGSDTIFISEVMQNSAAAKAGLTAGDVISQIDDVKMSNAETLHNFTTSHKNQSVTVKIKRNGFEQTKTVTLANSDTPLGVSAGSFSLADVVHERWWQVPWQAITVIWSTIVANFQFLGSLVGGIFGLKTTVAVSADQLSGPVGIFGMVAQFAAMGWVYVLLITAQLSLAVAIFNILPIPALDGGRILFILLNKIFGKKIVSEQIENIVHLTGFALLMLLFVFVTYRDILKLIK
ncbi:MAG: M50 family metallopeptidase [Patescibacteria group bacterium]|jgi:regulator of sigma E protease